MADFWSFAERPGQGRDLYILTEVASAESWFDDVVTPKRFVRQLNAESGDVQLWIDSPGGDAFAGAAIYEALRTYSAAGRGRVSVNVVGLAASAASLIAMAGDEVRMSIVGTIMLHDPWSAPVGNADKLRATADVLDEIREGQIRAYMRKSGRSYDEILELIRGDGTYMNAKSAIEMGFADGIMSDEDAGAEWIGALASVRVRSCAARRAEAAPAIAPPQADADAQRRALMCACMESYRN